MTDRRRLPRFAPEADREGTFFFLRLLVGGRSAGSAGARIEARLDPCPGFLAASAEHR
jgi:hypothetical protein